MNICTVPVICSLKVDCKEKGGESEKWRILGSGLGLLRLSRSRVICFLNLPFVCNNLISVSACNSNFCTNGQCGRTVGPVFTFLNSFDCSDTNDRNKAGTTGKKPERPESWNARKAGTPGKPEWPESWNDQESRNDQKIRNDRNDRQYIDGT